MNKLDELIRNLIDSGVAFGKNLLAAILIYFIGRYIIKFINKLVKTALEKRDIDPAIKSFVSSLVNIALTVMLLIAAISALGVETTSFAALIASAGVAIGMALSGNLQNFAGGLMILLFKPYRVGDYIESNGHQGIVKEIQIFHTIILTVDNKMIFLPNSSTSSSTLVNYSKEELRRVDLVFGVEYGVDFEKVRETIARVYGADSRVLNDAGHELFIGLGELAASSVNITVRAWVKSADYWGVYFDMQKNIYKTFNEEGIGFPFPQITVSQLKQ